ncbi:hypothetical protein N7539_001538 [Penicillium diatomitis]|uniref:Methyltransferase domain-containing protein n=1 Tax=Penicillium diatomitis TaxID=2819901 RepID=A0A9W9XGV0_9EURO|nr:uncharacterized protein N7539_001538 [Penicillium diatomitis]KAJ5492792.1 hypothetical protein N7539_001538 [Penicillium diatomitis]
MDSSQLKADIKKAYDAIAPKYFTWTENTHSVRLSYVAKLLHHLDGEEGKATATSTSTVTGTSTAPAPAPAPSPEANSTPTIQDQVNVGPAPDTLLPPSQISHEPPSASILELGCGAGIPVTKLLAARPNTTITANDISSSQIALAKTHLPSSVRLITGDMMELELEAESLDAVLAMYSIFHLPRDEQRIMLARIHGWLKAGRWVLMNFAAAEFERASDEKWLGAKEGVVHWSGWGVEGTRKMLEEVGFEILLEEVRADEEIEEDGSVKKVEFYWVMARK